MSGIGTLPLLNISVKVFFLFFKFRGSRSWTQFNRFRKFFSFIEGHGDACVCVRGWGLFWNFFKARKVQPKGSKWKFFSVGVFDLEHFYDKDMESQTILSVFIILNCREVTLVIYPILPFRKNTERKLGHKPTYLSHDINF